MSSRPTARSLSCPTPNQLLLRAAVLAVVAAAVPAQGPLQFDELPRKGLPVDLDSTSALALGDVDGDGDLDLVVGNSGQNRLYLNDGTGTFLDVTATQMPIGSAGSLALGDVDGDGDLDLVLGGGRLYLNSGSGTFTDVTATQMPVGGAGSAIAVGDVDGDGDLDLVFGSSVDRLFLNDGLGTFIDATSTQLAPHLAVGWHTAAVALGDVDGDGDLDMVCGTGGPITIGAQTLLLRNDGFGTFSHDTNGHMPADFDNTRAVAFGDVDGDGDLDLIVGNGLYFMSPSMYGSGTQNRLYQNDGTGTFTDATAAGLPFARDRTEAVVLGDVDGDGDLDLVVGNADDDFFGPVPANSLLLNDGAGHFTASGQMPGGAEATGAVVLGDVDGDSDLDVVFGNSAFAGYYVSGTGQNRLLLNLQRQLDAPVDLQIGQTYTLDAYLRYGPPSPITFALPYVSFAPAAIPLPPLGTIGIDPAQAIALPAIVIPQPAGVGSLTIPVPNDAGLVGIPVYSQALLVPYPWPARLSNVVHDVVQ